MLTEYIFALIDYDFEANQVIQNGFEINKNWQIAALKSSGSASSGQEQMVIV